MKIKCNDLQTLNMDYENNSISIKFKSKETLVEFSNLIKNVFYPGPGFPDDALEVKFKSE